MSTHTLEGDDNRQVRLDGEWLNPEPSLKKRNHSPDGFNWGYGGSGPAQLALAIIMALSEDFDIKPLMDYQVFKWSVINPLPQKAFKIQFEIADEEARIIT